MYNAEDNNTNDMILYYMDGMDKDPQDVFKSNLLFNDKDFQDLYDRLEDYYQDDEDFYHNDYEKEENY